MDVVDFNAIDNLQMERLHLRIMGDTIDVLYRPNHTYLEFLPNDEDGWKRLKEIAEYTRDDFVSYLKKSNHFPLLKREMLSSIQNSKLEEWYQCAWKLQTEKLLKKIGVVNPIEKPIFYEELLEFE